MKIVVTLLMLLALALPTALAQEYTQLNLPEGAVGRLGKGSISVVRYSPDGVRLAIATSIGIWLYDIGTHREIALITTHPGTVSCVAFSPDGSLLASGGYDDKVRTWNGHTGAPLLTLEKPLYSVTFSPDGKIAASADRDRTILLWDAVSGEPVRTIEADWRSIYSIAFSPDGKILANGSNDGFVVLSDVHTGKHLRILEGHPGRVGPQSVVFSPDGKILASSNGGIVYLWDLKFAQ